MFLRSKLSQQLQFFSQKLPKNSQQKKDLLKNIAAGSALVGSVYYYPEISRNWAKDNIKLFKSCHTPEQIKEIENSPEKSKNALEQIYEEVRFSTRLD